MSSGLYSNKLTIRRLCLRFCPLPPTILAFLEGFASGDQARAREAVRKTTSRDNDDPIKRASAEERRLSLLQGRLALIGSLLCSLAVPSCAPGISEALCRLHSKEKWHNEEGVVLRLLGVVNRLPASERVRERERESAPAPAADPSLKARLTAGGRICAVIDNLDISNKTNGSGDAYSVAKKSFHLTSSIALIYHSRVTAGTVASILSKGMSASVASRRAAAAAALPPTPGGAGPSSPAPVETGLAGPASGVVGFWSPGLGRVGVGSPALGGVGRGVRGLAVPGRGTPFLGVRGRGSHVLGASGRGSPVLGVAGRGVIPLVLPRSDATALGWVGRGVSFLVGPGFGAPALGVPQLGMAEPGTAALDTVAVAPAAPTADGGDVAAPSFDRGGLAAAQSTEAASSARPAPARGLLAPSAPGDPVATPVPTVDSEISGAAAGAAMDGVAWAAPSAAAAPSGQAVHGTAPASSSSVSSELESVPPQPARSCTALPERDAPSVTWFAAGGALLKAEGVLAALVPELRAGGISDLSVEKVTKAIEAMSDRRGDELVAEILILPTSMRAATTNRGIMDALDNAKAVMPLDEDSMQVTGDQSCYVRIAEVQKIFKKEYEWAVAYPGTSRPTRTGGRFYFGYLNPQGKRALLETLTCTWRSYTRLYTHTARNFGRGAGRA